MEQILTDMLTNSPQVCSVIEKEAEYKGSILCMHIYIYIGTLCMCANLK